MAADPRREAALVVPTVPVETVVRVGDPVTELVAACADADLLVLGRHGHRPWQTAPLGGVAAGCLRHAHCPVVLLPQAG